MFYRMREGAARYVRLTAVAYLIGGLAACGGGGGGGTTPVTEDMDGSGPSVGSYTEFTASTPGATSALQSIAIENGTAIAMLIDGTLDHENSDIIGGDFEGALDGARTQITLGAGGTVTLTSLAGAEFLRVFDGTIDGDNVFGIIGVPTLIADIPGSGAGSATYNGMVRMNVQNGDGVYVLTGDTLVTANWNGQTIITRFDDLSGTLNASNAGTVSGVLQITGATISGDSYSGGTATIQTGIFASTDAAQTLIHAGGFFGVNADETGGVVVIDASDIQARAVFVAE